MPKSEELFADVKFKYNDLNLNKVDLLHFFNNISYGNTPWISTFETFLPRNSVLLNHQENGIIENNKKIENALAAISAPSCKKIIALSESTAQLERSLLEHYPQYKKAVLKKMEVVHPPQPLFVESFESKPVSIEDPIKFILVGSDFFRKGGLEVLLVFEELVNKKKLPFELTIVSSMGTGDYASGAGKKELNKALEIINKNKEWIHLYSNLPNQQVIELMIQHHIGLLPTWADTYGYTVLELQASGCPVITTDVRALPEINKESHGWLIRVPKNEYLEALYTINEERLSLSNAIIDQLMRILVEIENNRSIIEEKSNKAIDYIRMHHSEENYAKKMKKIYIDALNE
ncbi:glycosyltransferase family 4 protein [Marinilactibacillus psychrotolerans]|nr:glycosyltransferase family 4 protein [Marinilactibacillus psychrotolerans]